jgi:hypothetical protein
LQDAPAWKTQYNVDNTLPFAAQSVFFSLDNYKNKIAFLRMHCCQHSALFLSFSASSGQTKSFVILAAFDSRGRLKWHEAKKQQRLSQIFTQRRKRSLLTVVS